MAQLIVASYLSVLTLLMLYCLHRLYLVWLYLRTRRLPAPRPPRPAIWPMVTVQLPVYNERYVVERLIRAVAALDYPIDRLEVQVLDDSTDETTAIAARCIRALSATGIAITLLHRTRRTGYKAGALAAGLRLARGGLIAVFDADFLPPPDFLKRTVPHFNDPGLGMVQTRWGHVNRDYSVLTQLQATLLDAHFTLEHTARNRSGRFFNFNGTAGVWRRACIETSGGWLQRTLTEDLDLSYRAQLAGWRFLFLPEMVTPAEIPVDITAFKTQQHRWAKGGIETARLLLPTIVSSRLPLRIKIDAAFHLSANGNYLLVLALALLTYPALLVRIQHGWSNLLYADLLCFICSALPLGLFYTIALRDSHRRVSHAIWQLPLLMGLGIGLSVNNGLAVIEALRRHRSGFNRTPKFHICTAADTWKHKHYRSAAGLPVTALELFMAAYFGSAIIFALLFGVYTSLPFLLLFGSGYLYVAVTTLAHACQRRGSAATDQSIMEAA